MSDEIKRVVRDMQGGDDVVTPRNTKQRGPILDAAREAVLKDRAAEHGDLHTNFTHIAAVWSIRTGVEITPAQAAMMLIDLKIARAWGNPGHDDNFIDMAGYAACAGELADGT